MTKLLDMLEKNVGFVIVSLIMMAFVYLIALLSEKIIERKTNTKFSSQKTKINKMVIMAMLSAIAVVLMYFDFPLTFIAPAFYKIDFSEVPVLIGSFMLGPCAGVLIEIIKVMLYVFLKGTSSAFVGEFANFIFGSIFVVTASVIYHCNKTKKMAVISLVAGGILFTLSGMVINAVYLLPKYSELYGMPIESFIAMGNAINPAINNVFTFVAIAVAPFNIIKALADGIITILLYKHLSRHLKS